MPLNPEQFDKLESYLDGTLDAGHRHEVELLLSQDADLRQLMDELGSTRTMMGKLPKVAAPKDMADSFQSQMERAVLFGDTGPKESDVLFKINHYSQLTSIAAILMLAMGLGLVLYKVMPSHHTETAIGTPGLDDPSRSLDGVLPSKKNDDNLSVSSEKSNLETFGTKESTKSLVDNAKAPSEKNGNGALNIGNAEGVVGKGGLREKTGTDKSPNAKLEAAGSPHATLSPEARKLQMDAVATPSGIALGTKPDAGGNLSAPIIPSQSSAGSLQANKGDSIDRPVIAADDLKKMQTALNDSNDPSPSAAGAKDSVLRKSMTASTVATNKQTAPAKDARGLNQFEQVENDLGLPMPAIFYVNGPDPKLADQDVKDYFAKNRILFVSNEDVPLSNANMPQFNGNYPVKIVPGSTFPVPDKEIAPNKPAEIQQPNVVLNGGNNYQSFGAQNLANNGFANTTNPAVNNIAPNPGSQSAAAQNTQQSRRGGSNDDQVLTPNVKPVDTNNKTTPTGPASSAATNNASNYSDNNDKVRDNSNSEFANRFDEQFRQAYSANKSYRVMLTRRQQAEFNEFISRHGNQWAEQRNLLSNETETAGGRARQAESGYAEKNKSDAAKLNNRKANEPESEIKGTSPVSKEKPQYTRNVPTTQPSGSNTLPEIDEPRSVIIVINRDPVILPTALPATPSNGNSKPK